MTRAFLCSTTRCWNIRTWSGLTGKQNSSKAGLTNVVYWLRICSRSLPRFMSRRTAGKEEEGSQTTATTVKNVMQLTGSRPDGENPDCSQISQAKITGLPDTYKYRLYTSNKLEGQYLFFNTVWTLSRVLSGLYSQRPEKNFERPGELLLLKPSLTSSN